MGVLAESTTVEMDLVEKDGVTTVRLMDRGLPPRASRITKMGCGTSPAQP
jgi:anti-sigma regulatory factor (Ser/Thr protein kinase)